MNDRPTLRERLVAGDPARGEALSPAEVARLRLAIETDSARTREAVRLSPRIAWAAVALVALAIVLGLRLPLGEEAGAPAPRTAPLLSENVKDQQVQFETADGVRIVWVLSPNLHL